MSYLLALLLPGLAVILKGRVLTGIGLLVLQFTLIGWIPAAIVAVGIVNNQNNKQIIQRELRRVA